MKKVYLASPYTGNPEAGVRRQIDIGNILIDHGFNPFVPLLYHHMHVWCSRTDEEWLDLLTAWIADCDCVLRFDGVSLGADREVVVAKKAGIKVYYSIEELIEGEIPNE